MAKTFSVSFNINGAMDGSLAAALQNASRLMRGLGESARATSSAAKASQAGLRGLANSLGSIQQAAQQFKTLQDAVKQTAADFQRSTAAIDAAKAKYQQDAQAVEQLRQKLVQLSTELAKAKNKKLVQSDGVRAATADLQALKRAYEAAKTAGDRMQMSSLSRQIEQTQQALERQRRTAREAAQSYKELSDKLKQTKADLKAAETAANQSGQGLSRVRTDAQNLSQSFQQQLAALNRLKASLSAAGFDTSNFAASEARLQSEINRVNAALERQAALQNAQRASSQASQEMFNSWNNFQGALQTAESIAMPFESAIDNAMTLEKQFSRLKALTQLPNIRAGNIKQVEADMASLEAKIKGLGMATEYTSNEIAGAANFYAMSGWDPKKIEAALPSTVDLASITQMPIATVADYFSDDLTIMGIKAGEQIQLADGKIVDAVTHFTDSIAYATTKANLDYNQLHTSLTYNAPSMLLAGLSQGDILAANMVSANAGLKGSVSGTALRTGFIRLQAPAKAGAKALEEIGSSASEAQKEMAAAGEAMDKLGINGGDMISKLEQIKRRYDENLKLGEAGRAANAAMINDIFGKNGFSTWANLLSNTNLEQMQEIAKAINSSEISGWSADTAAIMRDNTRTAIDLLTSAMDALQEKIGTALTPTARLAAETFAPMVASMAQWVEAHPAVVQAAAAIAGALAGIVVAAAAVKLAFAGWTFITSTIALVQTGLASLGSGALLGGLIGRLAALRTMLFGLGGAATLGGWSAMFGAIATKATDAMRAIRGFFASLTLGGMASGVVGVLQSIGTAILGAARAAMMFALSPVGVALMALALAGLYCYQNWDKVAPVLSKIASIITGGLSSAIARIANSLRGLKDSGGFEALCSMASRLASIVGGVLVKAFAVLLTVAATAISVVIQMFGQLIATVIDFGTGLADAFAKIEAGNWSGALDALGDTATKTLSNIKQMGSTVFDGVKQGAKDVQQVLNALSMPSLPSKEVVMRHAVQFDENGQAHSAPEVAPIDTSATQAALDSVGDAAANAATNMDGVNQAVQNISQVGSEFQTVSTNAQTAGTNVQTLGQNSQLAGEAMLQIPPHAEGLNTALDLPIGNLGALGDAAGNSVGNIDAMSTAAGAVASALSAKATEIGNIHISIPTVSVGGAVAANAEGGIYRRGAFLTTFAEESPEAAIPLDNSKRARDLWAQAGQMLGMFPQTQSPQFDVKLPTPTFPQVETPNVEAKLPTPTFPQIDMPNVEAKLPTPTFPQIDLPQGEEISARQSKRRRPQGTMPPVKMPRRETPKFLDVLGRALGGGFRDIETSIKQTAAGRQNSILSFDMPTPTFPTIESPQEDNDFLNAAKRYTANLSTQEISSAPTINVTVNVTIHGNADETTVRRGVESATPALNSAVMDAWFNARERERRRRSFA